MKKISILTIVGTILFCINPRKLDAAQTAPLLQVNMETHLEQDTDGFVIKDNCLVEYNGHDAKVVIPKGVVCIASEAFMWNQHVVEVTIPEGVDTIREFTFFGCTSLKEVHLPDSLRYIADNAFGENISLVHLVLPKGMQKIGMFAFAGCTSLEDVQMPESLDFIGDGAFSNCQRLKSIDLSGVKAISENVFSAAGIDFSGLEHLPEMSWGNAFRNSDYWKEYGKGETENVFWIVDGVLLSGQNCSGKVEIPDTVTTIAACAFENNGKITSVIMPNTVTEIGQEAFSGCKKLKTVGMKDSVTKLGEGTFSRCPRLSDIRLSNQIAILPSYVFEQCPKLLKLTLPEQAMSVEEDAFPDVTSKEITMPTGIYSVQWISGHTVYVTDVDEALQSPVFQEVACQCEIKELALNNTKLTLHVGEKYPLRFNSGAKAVWKSSRRSVATVGGTGNIYAKKTGTTVITATIYGKEYTCKVKVVK